MSPENSPAVRILIVEDERLIRWSLAQTLGAAGAIVVEASDISSATAALRDGAPAFDAVVLDVRLPDGNGIELLATIRRLYPATRVLLMTAYGTPELQDQALALGALGLVEKPFDLGAIAALVMGLVPTA